VLLAASLWATIGLFYNALAGSGLPLITIVFCRAAIAATLLFLTIVWRRRSWPRLGLRDWPLFLGFGLVGVAAFYVLYIYAISLNGVGVAAILLYTAPAWVTLIGVLFLGESLTWAKSGALFLACGGCVLVSRIYNLSSVHTNLPGLLTGLGAGITYGLYTVFSKVAQRRYTTSTTLAYALGLGALFLLPLQSPTVIVDALAAPPTLLQLLTLGIVQTLVAGLAFNAAVRILPASEASIVATAEPVIAALLGWAFLGERMDARQLLGAGMILAAVGVLQWQSGRRPSPAAEVDPAATALEAGSQPRE
jgi:DME family drug/metabolite transporter